MELSRLVPRGLLVSLALVCGASGQPLLPPAAPPTGLYLVPNGLQLDQRAFTPIHHYGAAVLVHLDESVDLAPGIDSRLHRLPELGRVSFRGWQDRHPEPRPYEIGALPKGYYLVALAGPIDTGWLEGLDRLGCLMVAIAHPYALVIKADGAQLAEALQLVTSEGFRVVRGVTGLPPAARMSPDLMRLCAQADPGAAVEVRMWTFADHALPSTVKRIRGALGVQLDTPVPISPDRLSLPTGEIADLVAHNPEISYLEPTHSIQLHSNLAARSHILDVETVWDELEYNGADIIVGHNDTGADPGHPDLPPAVITATLGRMAYTDNGHGTHTAGCIVGRGGAGSPLNTSGCGDVTTPLPEVRGMAWGARLASNNILDGGLSEISEMMRWNAEQGAAISSNSWGLVGTVEPITSYSFEAVAVDAAVRDADPSTPEYEPLTILFSAGNTGPEPATVSSPGTAKNAVTVGASHNDRCGWYVPDFDPGPDIDRVLPSSGRGPCQDRIKPDLVAPGSDVLASESADDEASNPWDQVWTGERYALATGTSQACALAAGAAAVFHEFFWCSFAARPSPALVKAALINGAVDTGLGYPSQDQGWGRLDLGRSVQGPPDGRITFLDQSDSAPLTTGASWHHELEVFTASEPLEITLVWSDVPGEAGSDHPLVNDLDLVVIGPDGTVFRGNAFSGSWSIANPGAVNDATNTVEHVIVATPMPGTWAVDVVAVNVAANPPGLDGQDFALVYSGDAADCAAAAPPSGVEATSGGDNRIDVVWHPVPGALQYEVRRATRPGGRPYQPVATVAAPSTMFSDTEVSGGITYYYVVRALTDCWSELSAEAAATTSGACLEPPSFAGLQSVADAGSVTCSLELSWQPATSPCGNAVTYSVHRSDAPDFAPDPETVIASGLAETTYTDAGLGSSAPSCYLVRAVDTVSGLGDSNSVVRSGIPSGPDRVHLREDAEGGGEGWSTAPGSDSDPGTEPWAISDSDARSSPHSWHCRDEDTVKDQVLAMATPLAVPEDVSLVLEFWHRFVLEERRDGGRLEFSVDGGYTWHDMLGGDGFSIPANSARFLAGPYADTLATGSGLNPLAGDAAWTGNSHGWLQVAVDLGDFAGRLLLLRWRLGCDEDTSFDRGWWLDDIRILYEEPCQLCAAPAPPGGLVAQATDAGIDLGWDAVPGATAYHVVRATRAGGPYHQLTTVGPTLTGLLDAEVSGGTTYYYAVRVETDCLSELSEEAWAEALGPCTLAPVFYGLTAVADQREPVCSLELSWNPADSQCSGTPVSYRVYRSHRPGFTPGPRSLVADGITGTSYQDPGVRHGVAYHYVVRAMDSTNGHEDGNTMTRTGSPSGPDAILLEDAMEGGAGLWVTAAGSAADSGTEPWTLTDSDSHSGSEAWFCRDEAVVKDQVLRLAEPILVPNGSTAELEFWHSFDLDTLWDGGRLEFSTDDGATWHDILDGDGDGVAANEDRFAEGGYSAVLATPPAHNPLAGERAWTGSSSGWRRVRVSLADFARLSLLLRWRLGCDAEYATVGWWVDDVRVLHVSRCAPTPREAAGRLP